MRWSQFKPTYISLIITWSLSILSRNRVIKEAHLVSFNQLVFTIGKNACLRSLFLWRCVAYKTGKIQACHYNPRCSSQLLSREFSGLSCSCSNTPIIPHSWWKVSRDKFCDGSSYNVLITTMRDAISYAFPACPW